MNLKYIFFFTIVIGLTSCKSEDPIKEIDKKACMEQYLKRYSFILTQYSHDDSLININPPIIIRLEDSVGSIIYRNQANTLDTCQFLWSISPNNQYSLNNMTLKCDAKLYFSENFFSNLPSGKASPYDNFIIFKYSQYGFSSSMILDPVWSAGTNDTIIHICNGNKYYYFLEGI